MHFFVDKLFKLTLCNFWKVLFLVKQDNNAKTKLVIYISVYYLKVKHLYAKIC